eukprot:403341189
MPRRLPVRPAKLIGNLFVLFVFIVIGFLYYTFVFEVWGPKCQDNFLAMLLLAFFHAFFILLVWSLMQAMTTDPGQVPVFWGFHLGDAENKRRRYCLMCNVFKPERCHHCSACNRCVLNMDHHCPWINNCVGFWNRKYFMLLLVYVLLTTYFYATSMAYEFYSTIKWELDTYYFSKTEHHQKLLIRASMIQLSFVVNCLIGGLMTFFLKFHVYLMLNNKTTIENLEKKGQSFQSAFDMGNENNFYQVFGTNPWLWPFPVFASSGKPLGDGIYWANNKEDTLSSNTGKSPMKRSEFSPNQTASHSVINSQMKSTGSLAQSQQLYGSSQSFDKKFGNSSGSQNRQAFQAVDVNQVQQRLPPTQLQQQYQYQMSMAGQQQQQNNFGNYEQNNGYMNEQNQNSNNKIILHQQDQREMLKNNLNLAIMQNHQKAQMLSSNILQQKNSRQNTTQGNNYTTGTSSDKNFGIQNNLGQQRFNNNQNQQRGVLAGSGLNTGAPNKKVAKRR